MQTTTKQLGQALCAKLGSDDWCTAPGGGFFVKGHGFMSVSKARTLTGIKAEKRTVKPIATTGAAGQWNAFASLVLSVSAARKGA
jgi:hypothetical protein